MITLKIGLKRIALAAGLAAASATVVAAAESVVIYNAISTKVMQAYTEAFQKANPGVTVQVVSGGSGELLTRIRAERNNPRGDLLVGPDADVFDVAIDLFESHKSPEAGAFDAAAQHKDGKYYGFSTNFQAFIVNTKMMPAAQAPKTWTDLAKPEFKGKILMANPAQSGSAYSQMQQIVKMHGWDVMEKIIANTTFVPSSKLAFQNVAKGEIPVGLTSEFNILQSKEEGFPVEAVYPADGTALIIDANGIIKGGPNPANAKKFLDYISSKSAHEILVQIDKRRSARKDVSPPPGLTPVSAIKVVPYDTVSAATERTKNLEMFDKIFSRK
ncbi:MAG: extracellular solute-binding protein [Alphaproteobacteria bacterium]|nr:extracellular solute-binding protein [Alphaproteobacteria bacterium]